MNFRQALVAVLAALALCACAPKAPAPEPPAKPAPGSKLMTPAGEVFTALDCAKKPLPFLLLESNTLTPNPTSPGTELHHRMVYVFCPAPGGQAETGTLTRSLSLKGKRVFSDVTKPFDVTPGRVAVDAFLTVPPGAEPGNYVYGVEYVSDAEAKKRKLAQALTIDEKIDLTIQK